MTGDLSSNLEVQSSLISDESSTMDGLVDDTEDRRRRSCSGLRMEDFRDCTITVPCEYLHLGHRMDNIDKSGPSLLLRLHF